MTKNETVTTNIRIVEKHLAECRNWPVGSFLTNKYNVPDNYG